MLTPVVKALLVEDEVLIRMTLRFMLEDLGCEVVGETAFGEEVRSLSEQLAPDVIFMDIRLKGSMDGIDAAREIHGVDTAAVVFMSAYDYEQKIKASALSNVVAFINKPFLKDNIAAVLPSVRSFKR